MTVAITSVNAAADIAGERGYEGTSINLVSERSGLPASSIYWHFKDKDELIAAVIDRSFTQWADTLEQPVAVPDGATGEDVFRIGLQRTGRALAEFPDFLRLGLMLILERRPAEPTARARFIEARTVTSSRVGDALRADFADRDADAINGLVTLTMALADGLFIASQVDDVALDQAFSLMATAILGTAERLGDPASRQLAAKGS